MRQFDKQHATTIVATAAVAANRFIAYDGGYPSNNPTSAGAGKAVVGVTEHAAAAGEAVSVITRHTAVVETAAGINLHALIQPSADGRAMLGSATSNCGRALEAATLGGQFIEIEIYRHIYP